MITFQREHNPDLVVLVMGPLEYEYLMSFLAFAIGAASRAEPRLASDMLAYVNALNRDNPDYTPLEIAAAPAESVRQSG
jgi:hypothetical protein